MIQHDLNEPNDLTDPWYRYRLNTRDPNPGVLATLPLTHDVTLNLAELQRDPAGLVRLLPPETGTVPAGIGNDRAELYTIGADVTRRYATCALFDLSEYDRPVPDAVTCALPYLHPQAGETLYLVFTRGLHRGNHHQASRVRLS